MVVVSHTACNVTCNENCTSRCSLLLQAFNPYQFEPIEAFVCEFNRFRKTVDCETTKRITSRFVVSKFTNLILVQFFFFNKESTPTTERQKIKHILAVFFDPGIAFKLLFWGLAAVLVLDI
ncbi:hypothetical protein QG37_02253 [Candidozyma auris]|uniref:Uncharacterized protein n=1 Tax=Candidozyma auris TaxID=498019 RepID=A0A0L0P2Z0_CANAR|nr:hypothetical protein QG37_02253 [[Candida] auris]